MSHSKRNTSLAFFTSYERSLLKTTWGSQSSRLSRDSFLPFAACRLCLLPARDPVACAAKGDIFCRECAVSNLLAQRKEIKRLEKEMGRRRAEEEERVVREEEEGRARAVEEFERGQMGLGGRLKNRGGEVDVGNGNEPVGVGGDRAGGKKGQKRKFELDGEERVRIAKEERTKARRELDEVEDKNAPATSFWIPSQTPTSHHHADASKPPKLTPVCPASSEDAPHHYALKTLIPVSFTEEADPSTSEPRRVCPSCRKALSNATKAMLTKPCGHVLCKPCVERFMTPRDAQGGHDPGGREEGLRCYVCDADLSGGHSGGKEEKERIKPGLIEINAEGTGFAGGGKSMVKKEGTVFQC